MRLPKSWLEKPASRLVKHFFATYATQFAAMPVVDPRRYCLVSTATGAEIASGPLGETVGGEGCVLSVCPRVRCAPVVAAVETARSAADDATLSEDDVVEVEEDDVIEVDEETQLHDIELPTEVVTGEFTDAELLMADDDLFKYYMLEMYEHKNNNNKHVQYMKARKRLRSRLRASRVVKLDESESSSTSERSDERQPEEKDEKEEEPAVDAEAEALAAERRAVEAARIAREKNEPKDWGAINYHKSLCPFAVSGRRCHKKDRAECTYAHHFEELLVEQRGCARTVCAESTTAEHALGRPEWWQMGVFAEETRQCAYLWKRMTLRAERLELAQQVRRRALIAERDRALRGPRTAAAT